MKKISDDEFDAIESTIDTEYFGVVCAKVLLKQACVTKQEELLSFVHSFEFVVINNRANNPFNNHWLGEKTKAFLTDMNVQLNKKVFPTGKRDGFTKIAEHFPENRQVIHIAENAFQLSRFLNDPYLPVEKSKHIYADITKNAFNKDGRFFVTFNETEAIRGFLLFSIDQAGLASTIELVAIDQNFTGKGIGRMLINAMENHVAEVGVMTVGVGTQLDNISALKFYASCGFSYSNCKSIYHYWPLKP